MWRVVVRPQTPEQAPYTFSLFFSIGTGEPKHLYKPRSKFDYFDKTGLLGIIEKNLIMGLR